jgi:hypothetical protein
MQLILENMLRRIDIPCNLAVAYPPHSQLSRKDYSFNLGEGVYERG